MARRKSKPTADRHQADAEPAQQETPASHEQEHGQVTLWGSIIREDTTHLTFAIANTPQTKELGLCGEHVFAKRQIFRRGGPIDRLEYIVVSYALANLKAQSSQRCD